LEGLTKKYVKGDVSIRELKESGLGSHTPHGTTAGLRQKFIEHSVTKGIIIILDVLHCINFAHESGIKYLATIEDIYIYFFFSKNISKNDCCHKTLPTSFFFARIFNAL
jgi:hypothetical protein